MSELTSFTAHWVRWWCFRIFRIKMVSFEFQTNIFIYKYTQAYHKNTLLLHSLLFHSFITFHHASHQLHYSTFFCIFSSKSTVQGTNASWFKRQTHSKAFLRIFNCYVSLWRTWDWSKIFLKWPEDRKSPCGLTLKIKGSGPGRGGPSRRRMRADENFLLHPCWRFPYSKWYVLCTAPLPWLRIHCAALPKQRFIGPLWTAFVCAATCL